MSERHNLGLVAGSPRGLRPFLYLEDAAFSIEPNKCIGKNYLVAEAEMPDSWETLGA